MSDERVKKRLINKRGYTCANCGISTWMEKPLTLELEHIDGDAYNNKDENLCLLCPNCHSQTPTFRGKNRGKGRKSRQNKSLDRV